MSRISTNAFFKENPKSQLKNTLFPPNAMRRKIDSRWMGGFSLGIDLGLSRTRIALSKGFSIRPLMVLELRGQKLETSLLEIAQQQKRKYSNLKHFPSGKKGYGLQLQEDIPKGRFLIEYIGEVLDMPAYEARQKEYASKGHKHFYFMTLNGSEVIDACAKGNLGRFINHSCEPNCRTEKFCRYLFYLGKIRMIQLEYTDAKESLLQAARKAPVAALGFRVQCNKWAVIVRLLLGEIPERTVFMI